MSIGREILIRIGLIGRNLPHVTEFSAKEMRSECVLSPMPLMVILKGKSTPSMDLIQKQKGKPNDFDRRGLPCESARVKDKYQ